MEYSFEKLEVWQNSKMLVKLIYQLSNLFPPEERYVLCSQMQRAAVSVPSNIAEGVSRISIKEKVHFIEIAYGSLMEVYCQLQIAVDLEYITPDHIESLKPHIFTISRQLNHLRKSYEAQLHTQ